MRSTEVTVNKNNGSYNQHMHVLLCVESVYFNNKVNYITQEEWINLWQKTLPYLLILAPKWRHFCAGFLLYFSKY